MTNGLGSQLALKKSLLLLSSCGSHKQRKILIPLHTVRKSTTNWGMFEENWAHFHTNYPAWPRRRSSLINKIVPSSRSILPNATRNEMNLNTVFENHRKSLSKHFERSELHLYFEWTKEHKKCQKRTNLTSFLKPEACGQTELANM